MERPPARRDFALFLGYWLPVLAYATLVLVVGSQPHLKLPIDFHEADKFYHVAEYGVLGFLLARALRASMRVLVPLSASLMAVGLGGLVGVVDELHQRYVPGRSCDVYDLLADLTGLMLVQIVFLLTRRD